MTRPPVAVGLFAALLVGVAAPARQPAADPVKGQRVFCTGHSFHMPMIGPFEQIAKSAKIDGHRLVGSQGLGGSTVTQHWALPDDKDKARKAIKTQHIDVLTVAPHRLIPDPAIDKFTDLLLEHSPYGRVTVQMSWVPFDTFESKGFTNDQRDAADPVALRKAAVPWVEGMRKQAAAINKKHSKEVVFLVPVGEAVIRLREKVVKGEVPGFAKQSELFTDPIGHSKPPIAVLTAYCHFAVIYGRTPVGLPTPAVLAKATDGDKLNRLLQEIAWEAVLAEPMSGVKKP